MIRKRRGWALKILLFFCEPKFRELRTSEVRRIVTHPPTAQGRLGVSRSRTSVTTTWSRRERPHPGQRQTAVA
jgi:hypothetical protein